MNAVVGSSAQASNGGHGVKPKDQHSLRAGSKYAIAPVSRLSRRMPRCLAWMTI